MEIEKGREGTEWEDTGRKREKKRREERVGLKWL